MPKVITLIAALLLPMFVQAEIFTDITSSAKVGITYNQFYGSDAGKQDNKIGWLIGSIFDKKLTKDLAIRSGLNWEVKGSTNKEPKTFVQLNYITVPIGLVWNIPQPIPNHKFYIMVGGYASYFIGGHQNNIIYNKNLRRLDSGWTVGTALAIPNPIFYHRDLTITIDVAFGTSKIYGDELDIVNGSFQFSLSQNIDLF